MISSFTLAVSMKNVARESKKTRTETSNLLEKGLIQKKNRFGVSDIAEQK